MARRVQAVVVAPPDLNGRELTTHIAGGREQANRGRNAVDRDVIPAAVGGAAVVLVNPQHDPPSPGRHGSEVHRNVANGSGERVRGLRVTAEDLAGADNLAEITLAADQAPHSKGDILVAVG